MQRLLDTNTVSFYLAGMPSVVERLQGLTPAEVGISSITVMELRYGVLKRRSRKLTAAVDGLLNGLIVHPFDAAAADEAAALKVAQERRGKSLAPADLFIAAHAKALGFVLVTHDRGFRWVKDLQVEDWVAS